MLNHKTKKLLTSIGNGLVATSTALHNSTIQASIDEIDTQLETLNKEVTELAEAKTKLEAQLIH